MIRLRSAAVAVCMMAFAGPACAQPQGNAQQGQRQEQNAGTEQRESAPSQPQISVAPSQAQRTNQSTAKPEVYEPNCDKPKDHDQADFCVQRRVAKTAEDSYQLTGLQTAIGALGLFFIVITLGVTAWTGKAASVAAQAAVDAVGAERAWVTPGPFDSGIAHSSSADGAARKQILVIFPRWINTGRSPAVSISTYSASRILDLEADLPTFSADGVPDAAGIAGPGFTFGSAPVTVAGDDYDLFKAGKKKLIVYSMVNYKTIRFNSRFHQSNVCAEIIWNGSVVKKNGEEEPNLSTRLVGFQNSVT